MRKITCYDCGKTYDYDVDDFCPRCGAYTQPARQSRINVRGDVVRVEGINEVNHKGSFVHAELHAENRQRRGSLLEVESMKKSAKKLVNPKLPTVGRMKMTQPLGSTGRTSRPVRIAPPLGSAERTGKKESTPLSFFGAVLAAIVIALIKAIFD